MSTEKPKMIALLRAQKMIRERVKPRGSEMVTLQKALGRILAENIVADNDLPPFDRSQMDGYALRYRDTLSTPAELRIAGESAAGKGWHHKLKPGEAVRIMTGASVPKGADSIQIVENTIENNGSVSILESAAKGAHIVRAGKEVRRGMCVLESGTELTPRSISIPAAFGYAKVWVTTRPRVEILSTGSEVVSIEKKPARDQIRNSNSLMLQGLCEADGCSAASHPTVGDDLDRLKTGIARALEKADILITTGGVSVGKYDLTKMALRELGAEIHFERVSIKPGKPVVFATLDAKLIFGLPGNPVSAAVTYYLLVRPALRLLQCSREQDMKTGFATASHPLKAAAERDTFIPAALETDRQGRLVCRPLKWSSSSDFIGFSGAEALIRLPKGTSASAGDVVSLIFLDR